MQRAADLSTLAFMRGLPMFRDRANTAATLVVGAVLAYAAAKFVGWAVVNAVWYLPVGQGSDACRAASGSGACWAVVTERIRFILFGTYPFAEQWRPAAACLAFIALYGVSAIRSLWGVWLLAPWVVVPAAAVLVMLGGVAGLSHVPTDFWGGLPLTFLLATVGFAAAFPIGIALALGRRSGMPVIRSLCVAYIELIRGVPFITFLYMAAVMFPLFVPQGVTVDKLLRAQVALVLVIAAYLAEVVRAGLQAVPKGQYEAAASMGLPFWPAMGLVVLPQALKVAIPSLVNTFIAFFKDTSLVAIIGLFDLLGAAKTVIVDPKWVGFGVDVYLFVAAVYFVFCFAVSRYSQRLEIVLSSRSHR